MSQLYINKLRQNNRKLTPKRKAIIELFLSEGRYLTPEEVRKGLRKRFRHLGLPTIYRNLALFSRCGILTVIQRPEKRLYYGLCRSQGNTHHHHIICVKCGRVGIFSNCTLFKKKAINNFKILSHSLQIEGICPHCR